MKLHARLLTQQGVVAAVVLGAAAQAVDPLPALAAGGGGHADISSLTFPAINFVLYVIAMTAIYFKAVKPAMGKRKDGVSASLAKAAGRLRNAEDELTEAKKRLAGIEQERTALMQELDKETQEIARNIVNDAKAAAQRLEEDTVNQVEAALARTSHQLRSELIVSAVRQAREELKSRLSDEQDAAVRDQVMAAFD